jgi:hypothetical protein
MQVCKVKSISIKAYPSSSYDTAVVSIDRWYKGTEDIRDNLMRGEAMYIPTFNHDLVAKTFVKIQPRERGVDEFGRDVSRFIFPDQVSKKSTTQTLTERNERNATAAKEFIANYIL